MSGRAGAPPGPRLDFRRVLAGEESYGEVTHGITPVELPDLTAEVYALLSEHLAGLTDHEVSFAPGDPTPDQPEREGWTLAQVIAHVTAGLEEAAALASALARGAEITGRSRAEAPWETISTAGRVRHRLAESERITTAFLQTWPDEPRLDRTHTQVLRFGPMNPVDLHLLGYMHAIGHLPQIEEVRRQAGRLATR